jgi:hypothetical protein
MNALCPAFVMDWRWMQSLSVVVSAGVPAPPTPGGRHWERHRWGPLASRPLLSPPYSAFGATAGGK